MKTVVVISDITQLSVLTRFYRSLPKEKRDETGVLALGLDVEYALEKIPMPFISAREFRTISSFDRMTYAVELADRISGDDKFSFFEHKDISLFSLYHIRIQWYIVLLTYYVDVFTAFIEKHRDVHTILTFYPTTIVSPLSDIAASFEIQLVPDTLRLVCTQRNIEYGLIGESHILPRQGINHIWFQLQRSLFDVLLFFANMAQLLKPRRKIRILASEYWKNIAPILKELSESEMVLLDRTEGLKAGIAAWWRHKVIFMQLRSFSSRRMRADAKEKGSSFARSFERCKKEAPSLREARFRDCTITPLIEAVMERIMSVGGTEGVHAIDCAFRMLSHLQPDVVIVRASASGQIHFSALCLVAKIMGIPSLEVQHGHLYMGEGSLTRRRTAEYIAVYGPAVRQGVKEAGYADEKIIDAGSPRFDAYRHKPLPHSNGIQVVCIAPALVPGFFDDTYEVAEYFEAVAAALRDSGAIIAVKLRPGAQKQFFEEVLQRTFSGMTYQVYRHTPIQELFSASDVIISPVSTVLFESLILGRPTIFAALTTVHYKLGAEFISYIGRGLLLARTGTEIKEALTPLMNNVEERMRMSQAAEQCILEHYSFDGNSARRIAGAIRAFVKQK